MSNKLRLCVTPQDYSAFAGPSWPDYEGYIRGETSTDPRVRAEITEYTKMKLGDGVEFPIKTATACQSKWTWSTIFLNQLSTASCHRVIPVPFSLEEFDDFHNIPKKLDDRKKMLAGEWPTGGCEYCRDIETAGGWSDRQHNLGIRNLTPVELETDISAIRVSPRIVEIFAQNTCNLRCTYCNSSLSSKIEQENRKFGLFDRDGVRIPITEVPTASEDYFQRFMSWLEKNVQHLKRLHLLGGETFLQQDLMDGVLGVLSRRPNPDLQLCVFSNFNVPDKNWDLYTNLIRDLQKKKHISRFDLTASIDCWGAEAEYARFGLDLGQFERRFKWAAEQDSDWIWLNVNQTVTCLTMKTMPGLCKKIKEYSKHRHIGHYFQFYTGNQMFQHPKTFAYDFWAQTFEEIYDSMAKDTEAQLEAFPRMQGLQKFLQIHKNHDWPNIKKLKVLLDELDRRRGTDWRSVFSYLDIEEPI